jgi:Fe-S-cluster-containing dehydrogenase component
MNAGEWKFSGLTSCDQRGYHMLFDKGDKCIDCSACVLEAQQYNPAL